MSDLTVAPRQTTVHDFIETYSGVEEKYELVDGVPTMMARANRRHNRIVRNLLCRIAERLDGTPCEVLAARMGVSVSEYSYRLPNVGIYCDPRDTGPDDIETMTMQFPKVLIEILPRSTERTDYAIKLDEYQAIESVDTIVFVHNTRDAFTIFERLEPARFR